MDAVEKHLKNAVESHQSMMGVHLTLQGLRVIAGHHRKTPLPSIKTRRNFSNQPASKSRMH